MATPKDNTTTKKAVSSMGMTFESGNPATYPIAYDDNVWDNVFEGSELASILGGSGQFDQHVINETLAEKINAAATTETLTEALEDLEEDIDSALSDKVDKSTNKAFSTFQWDAYAGRVLASDTDTAFVDLDVANDDRVTISYGYVGPQSGREYFAWFTFHISPTQTETVQVGRHNPLILRAHRDGDDNIYFTRESYPKMMADVSPSQASFVRELHDGNVYEYEPTEDFQMPRIPKADENRLGIAIYITPQTDVEMRFIAAYGPVYWLGAAPSDFTLRYGTRWLMSIVDGICSLQPVYGYEPEEANSPLVFTNATPDDDDEEPEEEPILQVAGNNSELASDGEVVE